MIIKEKSMKQTTDNKDFEEFKKWSEIRAVTTTLILVFWVGKLLLTILKEFTDFEEKAPFLYGKIFAGILLAVFLALVTLETICYSKTRKYIKQIEESEKKENDDETNDG